MEPKTSGAWLVHHSRKLQQVTGSQEYNNISAAGKAGSLLSALSSNDQTTLNQPEVEALAKAANINVLYELPFILGKLKQRNLIDVSKTGVDVLGVTTEKVLEHTAGVFDDLVPSATERASISIAEATSKAPHQRKASEEYLGDTCKLTTAQATAVLDGAEQIGFVDYEDLGGGDRVYFNGNLFRRDNVKKTQAVLASLTAEDNGKISQIEEMLKKSGCLLLSELKKILGDKLFDKLNAISMYDVSVVNNDKENIAYVTRPASFSKYGDPFVEDALDLAKAFVSSITYGMTRSAHIRGRITLPEKLIKALIAGRWIGPVDAIGQDYKVLEMKGVVKVRAAAGRGYEMKLLKREVGEIALQVIAAGDASDLSVLKFPSASVTSYDGPEVNREAGRRKQTVTSKKETRDIVMALRTGGGF
jgi:hypothetical protein